MEEFLMYFANILGVDSNSITMYTKQGEIPEWDSLMQIRIIAEIEDKYNIKLLSEDVSKYKSIEDFYELIKEQ